MTEDRSDIATAWKFWETIVMKDGVLDMEQLKKEMTDWYYVMGEVPKVYDHVSGGLLSKVMYSADTVIAAFDDFMQRQIDEAIDERLGELAGQTLCTCHTPPMPETEHMEAPIQ